ncbi:hypothetical protein SDC9_154989 [bioreactor metagenome]|uniref:PASTA domain-containing protein n=1 Tax=bioreactor metagenome TaxID=1076179 RepID=A0A645F091_9ZZZZ
MLEQCLKYYGYKPTQSTGTETVEVPLLIGKTAQEAKSALQAVGLVAEEDASGTGAISAQMPAAGTTVTKGSSVLVYSSEITQEPAQKVEVPDLTGKSKLRAYDALKEAGLIMDENALAAAGGAVESQSPKAGTMVEAGSVVTVRFKSD